MTKNRDRKLKAVAADAPKAPRTKTLKLTDRQKALLVDADRTFSLAEERVSLVFAGICAAAGIEEDAALVGLEGNVLTIQLAEQA